MSAPIGDRPIVVLVGATSVGKTRIAVELCRRLDGEIVGADSVQIYRELDIGSNKPTHDELRGVTHHMLDLLAPSEAIDAARYAVLADSAIADVARRGAVPFVVGGTGLWLRALLRGLIELPPVDRELRTSLEREWRDLGPEVLHARLRELDPQSASRVHASDMVRLVRALEVHAQTGHALGELQAAHALGAPRYRALTILLDVPLPHWLPAVEARTRAMLARGWVQEVRGLLARYGPDIKPLRSVGYRQLVAGLREGWPESELERQILRATRLYAKRQRNWFRGDPSVDLKLRSDEAAQGSMLSARLQQHLMLR
jgi:tRNA dimethylallyltransferase